MNLQNITFVKEKNIGILTINRPQALNALNTQVISEIDQLMEHIKTDPEVQVLIITGEGRAFIAGADIAEMLEMNYEQGKATALRGSNLFRKIELLEIPVIAAINGFALGGGCELAMSCDIRIASEKAKFGQPEVGLGVVPGYGGTQRLPRIVGLGMAKELIYTGKIIGAEEAEKIGLVNRVVPSEKLMQTVMELAQSILTQAPIAVRKAKVAINEGIEDDLESGLKIENEQFANCFSTKDQKEGMQAFLDKRKARFIGE